jgi:hypothetical protein
MNQSPNRKTTKSQNPRQRGITAVISMMFLLIFGSLAASMAIVSQGNLRTADSHLKINRSLAAAETGLNLMAYRLEQVCQGVVGDPKFLGIKTDAGLIHDGTAADPEGNAYGLWYDIAYAMETALFTDDHYDNDLKPYVDNTSLGTDAFGRPILKLVIPAVQVVEGGEPVYFEASMMPHPLPLGEQPSSLGYDDPFYDRMPYGSPRDAIEQQQKDEAGIDWDVSEAEPLDGRFIRVKVTGYDGPTGSRVYRSISMDFRLDKTIPFAVLSRSRVMIGRNVQIRGNVGSLFTETDKENGHPLQVQSDFLGLSSDLDDIISPPTPARPTGGTFHNELVANDIDGDNRLNIYNDTEVKDLPGSPASYDIDGDGYISDFDFFLAEFDSDTIDGKVTLGEFTSGVDSGAAVTAQQLFEMLDTAGSLLRSGYNDGFIDGSDLYAKVRGEVSIKATTTDWDSGLSSWGDNGTTTTPAYKDYLQGLIKPDYGEAPLTAGDPKLDVHDFDQKSFDTSGFASLTTETLSSSSGVANGGATPEYVPPSNATREEVPFGAAYPYDYYERPVHRNKVFSGIRIPKGTNALFENCRFQGVTFIELETDNGDENFNYVGMQESDGTQKHPDYAATVGGSNVSDTKLLGNNLRFHNCTFEGPIVSGATDGDQPDQYTHVRNKVTFTGNTRFDFDAVTDEEDKALYQRSSLLLPHVSVEMGSFDDAYSSSETLELSGAVVAGLIDIRGQVRINGTLITTFLPVSGVTPVKGDTAPQFNTTLGYFAQSEGDLEAELPGTGLGKVTITYDPTLALPDGILGPIELKPITETYYESGK